MKRLVAIVVWWAHGLVRNAPADPRIGAMYLDSAEESMGSHGTEKARVMGGANPSDPHSGMEWGEFEFWRILVLDDGHACWVQCPPQTVQPVPPNHHRFRAA